MEDIIIKKKDLENLGRKLMKKVYKFFHYDYYINYFEDVKLEKDKLEKYLVEFYYKNFDFGKIDFSNFGFSNKKIEEYLKEIENKSKYEEYLKEIENKIEDESLDINFIFEVLNKIKVDSELNGDLYCKKKAFIYIYCVFNFYYTYLKG